VCVEIKAVFPVERTHAYLQLPYLASVESSLVRKCAVRQGTTISSPLVRQSGAITTGVVKERVSVDEGKAKFVSVPHFLRD